MAATLLPAKERNMGGARIDPGTFLDAARGVLGLTRPITVKWSSGYYRRGAHRQVGDAHVITVSTYLDADELNTVLWHELWHAWQAEQFPNDAAFTRAYQAAGTGVRGYRSNRFEVEANEAAECWGPELRLTK